MAVFATWSDAASVTDFGARFHSLAASMLKLWLAIFSFAESLNTRLVCVLSSWVLLGLSLL